MRAARHPASPVGLPGSLVLCVCISNVLKADLRVAKGQNALNTGVDREGRGFLWSDWAGYTLVRRTQGAGANPVWLPLNPDSQPWGVQLGSVSLSRV